MSTVTVSVPRATCCLRLSIHSPSTSIYISKELAAGRIIGPLPACAEGVHVSRFGVIPKPHQPGKWRLITDLSFPHGCTGNDGIDFDPH